MKNWQKDGALLRNSQYEQQQKAKARGARATEAHAASGVPVHMQDDVPDQLNSCWLTCERCGARRLVDRWCKAAVDSSGYDVDVSAGVEDETRADARGRGKREHEKAGDHASRWRVARWRT